MSYLRLLQLRRSAGDAGGTSAAASAAGTGTPAATGDAAAADDDAAQTDTAEQDKTDKPDKTFTQADIDRVVQQTIAKERKRAEQAVANARTEAEKLAAMTADQRAEHERAEREAALTKREAELNRRELRATALQTLAEKGLPAELAETLDYTDADKCNASITAMDKAFRAAVQKGVESRMKGSAPAAGDATGNTLLAQLRKSAGLK